MKIHIGIHRFVLTLYSILWCVVFLTSLLLVLVSDQKDFWKNLLFAVEMCGGFFLVIYIQMQYIAEVILTEEGIFVRVLFRKRFYSWGEIQQAGVLFSQTRGVPYERLYLVKPCGSRRRYKDKTFLSRNLGRLICLPADAETRTYVTEHYGPLDFDLAYGKTEQSEVVEMNWKGETEYD